MILTKDTFRVLSLSDPTRSVADYMCIMDFNPFEVVEQILSNQEKAEKYDKWFKNNTLLGTALQEAIKTKHQNRILKSGLEEICNSIDYDYNPMDTEERMKKLLEKVNKK